MADNVAITAGVGTSIAADHIGGVLHQRVKISQGADGAATDVSSAAPLQVTLANTGANATAVKVDGSAVTQPVSGTVAISGSVAVTGAFTEYTEDSVADADPTGIINMLVRADTPTTVTSTDGDNISQRGTNYGASYVEVLSNGTKLADSNGLLVNLGANNDVTVTGTVAVTQSGTWDEVGINDSGNSITVDAPVGTPAFVRLSDGAAAITTLPVSMATNTPVGNVAHDSADSGAPIKTGGRARTSDITSVANDDRVDAIYDKSGRQVIFPYCLPENLVSGAITTAMTGTTSTSLIAAPGAGLYNYITQVTVSNAHATVGTDVTLQDGNGGTAFYTIPAAAVYGGAAITFNPPLRQPTSNTALYCVNITTGASTKVSASGFKGA